MERRSLGGVRVRLAGSIAKVGSITLCLVVGFSNSKIHLLIVVEFAICTSRGYVQENLHIQICGARTVSKNPLPQKT